MTDLDRRDSMLVAWMEGASFADIADEHGISRQRVHQIVSKGDPAAYQAFRATEGRDRDRAMARQLAVLGRSNASIGRELGRDPKTVAAWVRDLDAQRRAARRLAINLRTHQACRKCRKTKPLHEFGRRSGTPSGKATICLMCRRDEARARYHRTRP